MPTPEAKFHIKEEAAGESVGARSTSLSNGYDPQLANGGVTGAMANNGGDSGCLTVVNNVGSNGSSIQAHVDERLPLVEQRLGSPSGGRDLEAELRGADYGASGNARSASGGIEEGERVVDASSAERPAGWRKVDVLHECLLPMKLFEQKQVRMVLFVYVLFSVRTHFHPVCCAWC